MVCCQNMLILCNWISRNRSLLTPTVGSSGNQLPCDSPEMVVRLSLEGFDIFNQTLVIKAFNFSSEGQYFLIILMALMISGDKRDLVQRSPTFRVLRDLTLFLYGYPHLHT